MIDQGQQVQQDMKRLQVKNDQLGEEDKNQSSGRNVWRTARGGGRRTNLLTRQAAQGRCQKSLASSNITQLEKETLILSKEGGRRKEPNGTAADDSLTGIDAQEAFSPSDLTEEEGSDSPREWQQGNHRI